MFDPDSIPLVDDDELLARFIVSSNDFRSDQTVKPKLFLPFRHVELSVNRHRESSEEELWEVGHSVAQARNRTLYGRADILAAKCRTAPLDVEPKPLPGNPNHADIVGFPEKKEDQLSLAQKLASHASKRLSPPDSDDSAKFST